jgi:hypothetical protein
MKILCGLLLLLLCGFPRPARAGPRADFLILENPQTGRILNRYEQPLTRAEAALFLPNTPLEILNADDSLGDRLTPALRFRLGGEEYYLLKDTVEVRKLAGCTPLDDTLLALKSGAIRFYEKYPAGGKRRTLEKGERLARVFQTRRATCLLLLGPEPAYGFSALTPGPAWEILQAAPAEQETNLSGQLRARLTARIEAANASYRAFFSYFNDLTKQARPVPVWRTGAQDPVLTFTLARLPGNDPVALLESTVRLVQDLENILIGKPFAVSYGEGRITIGPRP